MLYLFAHCPSTPPSDSVEIPSLSKRPIHEPVLGTSAAQRVGGVPFIYPRLLAEMGQQLHQAIVAHFAVGSNYPVHTDMGEYVLIRTKRTVESRFKDCFPLNKVLMHVHLGALRLWVDIVDMR